MKAKTIYTSLRKLIAFLIIVSMCVVAAPSNAEAADQWAVKDDTGIFWVSTQDSAKDNAELVEQIQLFDSELQACGATETVLPIMYGEQGDAGQNDIILILDSSLGLPEEGYSIKVGNQVIVSASDADGLFYGCRYVEQSILAGSGLEVGQTYTDSPDCPERAFFLDCGRKYYSPEWIMDMIREMSWSNMNTIYLHFSEEMGFRLESKIYPWLAGADNTLCVNGAANGVAEDNGKYITQDEMRQIAEVAKLYHVEIIPSLDSPGHMNYAVKKYNEQYGTDIGNYFHYNGKTSIVQGSGPESAQKSYSRGIDISNKEAVTFAQNLYKEYAAFFRELGCTKFDIGGDELLGWGSAVVSTSTASRWKQLDHWKAYAQQRAQAEGKSNYSSAVAYDGFMYYMNDIYDIVSSYGYTSVRMWNDDALRTSDTGYQNVVELDKNIEIQYWTPDANSGKNTIWTYLNKGYKAYNFLNSYNYYVLGNEHTEDGSGGYAGCTSERIYSNWNPYIFIPYGDTNTNRNVSVGNGNIKGSAFCVWCDNPNAETAAQVKAGVLPLLRSNGKKAWDADANNTLSYTDFNTYLNKIDNVPTDLPMPSDIGEVIKVDISNLETAIEEYENMDRTLYTEETFKAYENAVLAGKELLTKDNVTQEEIDAAYTVIENARGQLLSSDKINDELILYNATFKTSRMASGKTATLSVLTSTNVELIELYDDFGNKVELNRQQKTNARTTIEDSVFTYVQFNEYNKGTRTYTIYGYDADGNRSAESLQASIIVR